MRYALFAALLTALLSACVSAPLTDRPDAKTISPGGGK